jgi:hypothetical protein
MFDERGVDDSPAGAVVPRTLGRAPLLWPTVQLGPQPRRQPHEPQRLVGEPQGSPGVFLWTHIAALTCGNMVSEGGCERFPHEGLRQGIGGTSSDGMGHICWSLMLSRRGRGLLRTFAGNARVPEEGI